jgi:hypothetical protein
MDDIDESLQTAIDDSKYSQPILDAIELGKSTLNRYYSKTDASEAYRIAIGTFDSITGTLSTDISIYSPRPTIQDTVYERTRMAG